MEKRDLYNENRELIKKTIFKDEDIPIGNYILMVVAFIENLDGKYLIQKRSELKGGEWAFTGGHPKHGESSLEGVKTEIKEELGIVAENPILFKSIKGKNVFCDLYYVKQDFDLDEITIQEEEVEKVKWASRKKIDTLIEKGEFLPPHIEFYKYCLEYLDNNT